jgi:hypothetical protein
MYENLSGLNFRISRKINYLKFWVFIFINLDFLSYFLIFLDETEIFYINLKNNGTEIYSYIFCVTIIYINGWSIKIIEGDYYILNSEDEIEKSQGAN